MNYDTIIIEMLSRIQKLEDEVKQLKGSMPTDASQNSSAVSFSKVSTADIRNYIEELKYAASDHGDRFLILKANDIHKAMKLRSRLPMVCNAMRQAMSGEDEILHETASGYSSTFEVKYCIDERRNKQ